MSVRRITALTGPNAIKKIRDTEKLLQELVVLLKTPQPQDLPKRVAALQEEFVAQGTLFPDDLRQAGKQPSPYGIEDAERDAAS